MRTGRCIILPLLVSLLALLLPLSSFLQLLPISRADDWIVGNIVGLCKGTEIRYGSSFSYGVHTVVPEDNWPVKIIGGPRYADGEEWWDISRREIDGGGTGWVYRRQAESCKSPPPPPNCSPEGGEWIVGKIVGLSKGTKIYYGSGFAYGYHTIVPEDNWAVKIIGGPRYADGWEWWDTSRREACDPSGGTGWVPHRRVSTGDVEITRVYFSPTSLTSGQVLRVEITVQNNTGSTIQTQGPSPNFTYNEGDTCDSRGYPDEHGRYRVGVDFNGRTGKDHPYRWGLGGDLGPGQSRTIVGYIRLNTSKTVNYWGGLVQEGVRWVQDGVGTTSISVHSTPTPTPTPNPTPTPTPPPPVGPTRLTAPYDFYDTYETELGYGGSILKADKTTGKLQMYTFSIYMGNATGVAAVGSRYTVPASGRLHIRASIVVNGKNNICITTPGKFVGSTAFVVSSAFLRINDEDYYSIFDRVALVGYEIDIAELLTIFMLPDERQKFFNSERIVVERTIDVTAGRVLDIYAGLKVDMASGGFASTVVNYGIGSVSPSYVEYIEIEPLQ